MKAILTILTTLCTSFSVYSQKVVVSNPKENVIYFGIPNPIDIMAEGRYCKDLDVSVHNGRLERTDNPCSYLISPDSIGKTEIVIFDKKSKKQNVLGKATFRVKDIPAPTAMIAGKPGGEIRKTVLKVQVGISAVLQNFDFDIRFLVTAYKVTILSRDKPIFTGNCYEAKFSDEVKQAFSNINVGDTVLFTNIKCISPDKRIQDLQPMEFRIIE